MHQLIIIAGALGRDPELRYAPSGKAVCNFSMATNRQYTGSDGQIVKEVTWFRVSVWGRQAETCNQYLKKGSKVLVEGRLIPDPKTGGPRIYETQNGPGASFEVNASTVRFLDSRSSGPNGNGASEHGANGADEQPAEESWENW